MFNAEKYKHENYITNMLSETKGWLKLEINSS